jgi:site-specific DNA recombinase
MSDLRDQKIFAFYGRTRTPMRARSPEAVQERTRQLSLASSLVETVNGKIALTFFDTASVPLSALRHRAHGRDLLKAVAGPIRPFDAVVIGDTRASLSASQFDELALLCAARDVELWCSEIGGAYAQDDARHADLLWQFFWDPHGLCRTRR